MKLVQYSKVRSRLDNAKFHFDAVEAAKNDVKAYMRAWTDFITSLNGVYTVLEQAIKLSVPV